MSSFRTRRLACEGGRAEKKTRRNGQISGLSTVFTTPFVRSAFHCMAEQLDLEIVEG